MKREINPMDLYNHLGEGIEICVPHNLLQIHVAHSSVSEITKLDMHAEEDLVLSS